MTYGREMPGYPYNLKAKLTRCLVVARREAAGKFKLRLFNHVLFPISHHGQAANDLIRELLRDDAPCMIARFGTGELEAALRGIYIRDKSCVITKFFKLAIGMIGPFWWDNSIRAGLCWNAGFFPPTDEALEAFSVRVCEDAMQIDILATHSPGETEVCMGNAAVKAIPLPDLEPFRRHNPWTSALYGKKVLVVHPFVDTIRSQYEKRRLLFKNPDMLPDFRLETYRTLSSFAGNKVPYSTWFDALDKMCADIAKIDFDIALIGCGAYGMSIGAYIKRELKRKAVHMGGATQLLFGIKGGRWDRVPLYSEGLYNEHWVRPFASDTVPSVRTIEGGCYW